MHLFASSILVAFLKISILCGASQVTWKATPFNSASSNPSCRTNTLSFDLAQGSGVPLNGVWPQHWTGQTVGWAGFIKVDGKAYSFLGDPAGASFEKAVQKSMEVMTTDPDTHPDWVWLSRVVDILRYKMI
ncbi:hypothetical protein C8R43DRAFT_393552 [Mycena crocata]|nr:hypothetical protein C8R43DRAFT_393552 [Mycena crocata]